MLNKIKKLPRALLFIFSKFAKTITKKLVLSEDYSCFVVVVEVFKGNSANSRYNKENCI